MRGDERQDRDVSEQRSTQRLRSSGSSTISSVAGDGENDLRQEADQVVAVLEPKLTGTRDLRKCEWRGRWCQLDPERHVHLRLFQNPRVGLADRRQEDLRDRRPSRPS